MNDLGVLLVEATARVTAFAAVGVALALILRRRGPAAGVLVAMTTLSGLIAVSAASLGPWPRFWSIDAATTTRSEQPREVAAGARPDPRVVPADPTTPPQAGDTRLNDFAREFVREFRTLGIRPEPEAEERWRWPAWFAAALLATSGLGIARLALALRAVARLRRGSQPIADPRLMDEVARLRGETGCSRPVELRETDDLTTPATIGWLRPVLLLPHEWRDWDDIERRVVLAHEMGHIRRGDYMLGLWAQACLALHVYHPLAHWLAARLRLEQELAADAWGARLSGGNRPYLEALARLALRRSGTLESSLAAWPARPFLPTRGTLLRRIEMLREADPNPLRTNALPPIGRVLTVAMLAAFGLIVAGIRGPASNAVAQQNASRPVVADADLEPADAGADVFDLAHAPANTMIAVVGRPAEILRRPEFQPVAALFNGSLKGPWAGSVKLKMDEVAGVAVLILRGRNEGGRSDPLASPTVILHATKPQDWKAVAGTLVEAPEVVPFEGQSYTRSKSPRPGTAFFTADDRTIVFGMEEDLRQVIAARKGGPVRHAWDGAWSRVKKGQVALAFDPIWILAQMPAAAPGSPQAAFASKLGIVSPLLDKATGYAVGLDLDKGLGIDLAATCSSDDGAKQVGETMNALITLAKNAVPGLRQQVLSQPAPTREAPLRLLGLAEPLLANARAEVEGGDRVVRLHTRSDGDVASVVQTLLPTAIAARTAASRAQSQNHLKQILLAMHNYADTNGHLPPSVIRPADGKPPYSWRVAILPYIEQNDLFKEYNFNEPWDSDSNRKLIDKMPPLYRNPSDESGNLAYFVVTGESTLFPPGNPGVRFTAVTDGLSNTIMVVEAKREIPWTKPEDIEYDPVKPMPGFGGFSDEGFNAGFADGAVRVISAGIHQQMLKSLLTRDGGEVVSADVPRPDEVRPLPAPSATPPATPPRR